MKKASCVCPLHFCMSSVSYCNAKSCHTVFCSLVFLAMSIYRVSTGYAIPRFSSCLYKHHLFPLFNCSPPSPLHSLYPWCAAYLAKRSLMQHRLLGAKPCTRSSACAVLAGCGPWRGWTWKDCTSLEWPCVSP